jgi:predicted N-acetyltransferase YhbS
VPVTIRRFQLADFDGVDALWTACFPDDPPHNRAAVAIPQKLAFQPDLFWVAEDEARIVGSIMAGYDGHRGWLYSVAVLPVAQRGGLGSRLVRTAEQALQALGAARSTCRCATPTKRWRPFMRGLAMRRSPGSAWDVV